MQSIKEMLEKIKPLYTLLLYLVLATLFFSLGRLSALQERRTPVKLEQTSQTESVMQSEPHTATVLGSVSTAVVASKNGTNYYFPWCGGVKNIKAENKVTFASPEAAEAKGYTKASNCKGL